MVVREFPFIENILPDGSVLRTFSNVKEAELVWHKDKEDRNVACVKNDGWKLQFENKLPFDLITGETYFIPKNTYHRILIGKEELIVKVFKLAD